MKILLALAGAVVGFVFGGVATGFVVFSLATSEKAELRKERELVPVSVPVEDLSPGQEVTFELISARPLPRKCLTSPDDQLHPDAATQALGQVLTVPLLRGGVLRRSHLAEAPQKPKGASAGPGAEDAAPPDAP